MALRYSLERGDLADMIETAVQDVLNSGTRTADIMAEGCREVGTHAMGDAVIASLRANAKQSNVANG